LENLNVCDVLENEVATLVNEYRSAGFYEIEFYQSSSFLHQEYISAVYKQVIILKLNKCNLLNSPYYILILS
jgi:hypothetical protein